MLDRVRQAAGRELSLLARSIPEVGKERVPRLYARRQRVSCIDEVRTGTSVSCTRSGALRPNSGDTAKLIVPMPEQSHPAEKLTSYYARCEKTTRTRRVELVLERNEVRRRPFMVPQHRRDMHELHSARESRWALRRCPVGRRDMRGVAVIVP